MEYKRGDVIQYTTYGAGVRTILVTKRVSDITDGRPGFEGLILHNYEVTGDSGWGYDDQIVCVVERLF